MLITIILYRKMIVLISTRELTKKASFIMVISLRSLSSFWIIII